MNIPRTKVELVNIFKDVGYNFSTE